MFSLSDELDRLARRRGSPASYAVDDGERTVVASAYGMAHRALGVANTIATHFGIASGVKGLTVLPSSAWSRTERSRCRPQRGRPW